MPSHTGYSLAALGHEDCCIWSWHVPPHCVTLGRWLSFSGPLSQHKQWLKQAARWD